MLIKIKPDKRVGLNPGYTAPWAECGHERYKGPWNESKAKVQLVMQLITLVNSRGKSLAAVSRMTSHIFFLAPERDTNKQVRQNETSG